MTSEQPSLSGAQPERTRLAWDRTVLALAALAALFSRVADPPLGPVAAATLIPIALALRVLAAARYRRARAIAETGTMPPQPGLIAAATIATVALSLVCLLVVVAG